ncbi:MAG: DUF4179 domain-containing protein [Thermaerobacter sp.]|nr:DUF4179 domain-containing protein [Thermaerobacter sp.]
MPRDRNPSVSDESLERRLRHHYQNMLQSPALVDQWIAEAQAPNPVVRPSRHRWRAPAIVAASVLGLATGAAMHWAPRTDAWVWAATHDIPILQGIARQLGVPGVSSLVASGNVMPLNLADRQSGVTVKILGSYADAVQTLLFLQTTHGSPTLDQITLEDQLGHRLQPEFSAWNSQTHQGFVQFSALPSWVWIPGAQLTLTINGLGSLRHPLGAIYQGHWQMTWDQAPPAAARTVSPDARAVAHGVTLTLQQYTLAPSAAVFHLSASVPWAHNVSKPRKQKTAPQPQFIIKRVHGSGAAIPILSESLGGAHVTLMAEPLQPGRYILTVVEWNHEPGPWTWPFTVSQGRP